MPRTAGERGGGRRNIVHAQRCTVRARATRLAHGSVVQRGSRARETRGVCIPIRLAQCNV